MVFLLSMFFRWKEGVFQPNHLSAESMLWVFFVTLFLFSCGLTLFLFLGCPCFLFFIMTLFFSVIGRRHAPSILIMKLLIPMAAVCALIETSPAQTFSVLHDFVNNPDGSRPESTLVLGGDVLYGAT